MNEEDPCLFKDLAEMKASIERLESSHADLWSESNNKDEVTEDLQNRAKLLSWSSDGYWKIWHQFFESYWHDIKHSIDLELCKRKNNGNVAAHEGDAAADAYLYQSGQWFHETFYGEIYYGEIYSPTLTLVLILGKYYLNIFAF